MRKAIAALMTVAAMAGVGVAAGPAAADVSNSNIRDYPSTDPPGYGRSCQTYQTRGVYGQYGAWGWYIDGCTVRLYCPSSRWMCYAASTTNISRLGSSGARVTQNARLRAFNSAGQLFWYRDQSCEGIDTCRTADYVYISGGQSASIQCNGVQGTASNGLLGDASNLCRLNMWYQ